MTKMKVMVYGRFGKKALCLLFVLSVSYIFWAGPVLAESDNWKAMEVLPLPREATPDFKLPSSSGEWVEFSSLKGKVILLNFWATWCGPCTSEMPSMERIYKKFKDKGFVILGINYREDPEKVKKYLQEKGLSFPILMDAKGRVSKDYRLQEIPVSYLIDREGKKIGKIVGMRTWDSPHAEAFIAEVLEK